MTDTIHIKGTTYRLVNLEPGPDFDLVVCQKFEDRRPEGEQQAYHAFRLPKGAIQRERRCNPTAERSNGRAQRGNGGKGKCTPFNGD